MNNQIYKCCICKKEFKGYGNNPYPYIKRSNLVCCDSCNIRYVIPCRIKNMREK